MAVHEGLLTVDDPVLKFFPDDAPVNPSENLKAMRVRHLLSMNTGHREDPTGHVFGPLYQVNLFGPWMHDKLAALSLPLPKGQPSSPGSEQWSGKTFKLESNDLNLESVAIKFSHGGGTLIMRDERGEHPIQVGYATWLKGTTDVRGYVDESDAACGVWTADDTYEVRICG
jgi:hypothetical protein